ncbi:hypothetical protein BJX66DRAFT_342074 [Aspergillus keveii]|uniref:RRM domain-containing protein n=1 Tax=Aspergillus keveii TaxID=714993 RepID=A0ABR4FTI3_9EURO
MPAPPPAPYTHLPPHSNSHTYSPTPAPSHQFQANHQPIEWNLPAEARILVGNLPMNCDPEVLRDQLKGIFSCFGLNWVDIENRCKHTVAFVQFHNFQQADQAIAYNQGINYYGRPLRIELPRPDASGETR